MYTVYSKDGCRYCKYALELLHNRNENVIIMKCENIAEMKDHLKGVVDTGSIKTFPQIFRDKVLIGGFTELDKLLTDEDNIFSIDGDF
ncbi:glutaredoxin [Paramecium bursaria Chlorella virus Fr5L]|nr:glutaredoxin [Paramecium bursaria Chlorella virus CZ-2]AGE53137.1 glutaredoxin [Paramecium bursaria Chlorella virus Fr5L]AGE59029.1 glutaredoxin [Paramecium bursaria Chlorella virus OR0704.2.2]